MQTKFRESKAHQFANYALAEATAPSRKGPDQDAHQLCVAVTPVHKAKLTMPDEGAVG